MAASSIMQFIAFLLLLFHEWWITPWELLTQQLTRYCLKYSFKTHNWDIMWCLITCVITLCLMLYSIVKKVPVEAVPQKQGLTVRRTVAAVDRRWDGELLLTCVFTKSKLILQPSQSMYISNIWKNSLFKDLILQCLHVKQSVLQ